VPFWLQIASIAAAPILGFVGVAIGVFVTEHNRRAAYVIEERKKVYLDFISMLANINAFWSNEAIGVMRGDVPADKISGFSKPMVEALQRSLLQIRLIGSERVFAVAQGALVYTLRMSMTALVSSSSPGKFDRRNWDKAVGTGTSLMLDFSDAARKDLGLPALERKEGTTDGIPEDVYTMVEDLLAAGKKKNTEQQDEDKSVGSTSEKPGAEA
jgi:hypothetical protein